MANRKNQEGVELLPSGKVTLTFDGETYEMRRPKIKEFREIQAGAAEIVASSAGKSRDDVIVEELAWIHDSLSLLSDKELPEPGELPVYFVGGELYAKLMAHWQAVPLVHSPS